MINSLTNINLLICNHLFFWWILLFSVWKFLFLLKINTILSESQPLLIILEFTRLPFDGLDQFRRCMRSHTQVLTYLLYFMRLERWENDWIFVQIQWWIWFVRSHIVWVISLVQSFCYSLLKKVIDSYLLHSSLNLSPDMSFLGDCISSAILWGRLKETEVNFFLKFLDCLKLIFDGKPKEVCYCADNR